MKLIVLILANNSDAYNKMQDIWRLYMNKFEYVKSYFIKYSSDLIENVLIKDDTIYIKGVETLIPGCLDKTIKSIEYLLLNQDFDFIFRTNMSSVIDISKLYSLLNNEIEAAGVIGYYGNQPFISGAGMLFSKKTCDVIISNKNILNYKVLDDVSIGILLTKNNINMKLLTRYEAYNHVHNLEEIKKDDIKDYYHFRCRASDDLTILIMKKLIHLIYSIDT